MYQLMISENQYMKEIDCVELDTSCKQKPAMFEYI